MTVKLQNRNSYARAVIRRGEVNADILQPKTFPGECVPVAELPPEHPALAYLVGERGIPVATLQHHDVRYCAAVAPEHVRRMSHAANRVVIPFYMEGLLVGWQARYLGTPPNKIIPKYFTCPTTQKRKILYNFDHARTKPFPVIVEGPTDAWAVGDHGVALLGKSMSDQQRQLVVRTWPNRPVIVMLDGDARQDADDLVEEFLAMTRNPAVPVRLPEGRDPGSFPSETLWAMIRAAADAAGIPLT